MMLQKKIGIWSVLALVISAQVGSGILVLPSILAPFGWYALLGWFISIIGAISIARVFAKLCELYPKTGGPSIYILHIFGTKAGFFVGWVYWIISWIGNTVILTACVGYLSIFLGISDNKLLTLFLQLLLLFFIGILNLKGIIATSKTEIFLTILKFIPLIIIPIFSLAYINRNNFCPIPEQIQNLSNIAILSKVITLTFWGFIGIESATIPTKYIKNPQKTIPRALIIGTLFVGIIYLLNSFSILGMIGSKDLYYSKAPYVDAIHILFATNLAATMSILAAVICISNLNTWTLASGQILLGLAENGFAPKFLTKKNKYGVPTISVLSSLVFIIPLLLINMSQDYSKQLTTIIDISVVAFLFIYLICALALLKILITQKKLDYFILLCIFITIFICSFIVYTNLYQAMIIILSTIVISLPIYLFIKNKNTDNL